MVRFADKNQVVEVTCEMYVGGHWEDYTGEAFAAMMVNHDRGLDAYEVDDVKWIIEYARQWKEDEEKWEYHGETVGDRAIEYAIKEREE